MQQFTKAGRLAIVEIAKRYGLSEAAVEHMLVSVNNGGGTMAQFDCPELGGSGQWMRGGMIMVGDMFNHNLKATVDGLCNELSQLLNSQQVFPVMQSGSVTGNQWWPKELGTPTSSGSQNNSRYAVFTHRLLIDVAGKITVYDTLDHQIGGVAQQQGGADSLSFTSQYGTLAVSSLPVVSSSRLDDLKNKSADSTPEAEPIAHEATLTASAEQAMEPHQRVISEHPGSTIDGSEVGGSTADISTSDSSTSDSSTSDSSTSDSSTSDSSTSDSSAAEGSKVEMAKESIAVQSSADDTIALIEKLAQLHKAGILSDDEFSSKKSELLARI